MAVTLPTAAQVRAIITTDLTDDQIDSYVVDASLLVARCISVLDEVTQTTIIKYTAAHLIQSNGQASGEGFANTSVTSMKLGDASESYARAAVGSGMASTSYGQQAIALDPNGCLLTIGQRPVVFKVL